MLPERGVEIRTGVAVKELVLEREAKIAGGVAVSETQVAKGVVTESGESFRRGR